MLCRLKTINHLGFIFYILYSGLSQDDEHSQNIDGKKSKKKKKKKDEKEEAGGGSSDKQLKRTEKIASLSNELVQKWKELKVKY